MTFHAECGNNVTHIGSADQAIKYSAGSKSALSALSSTFAHRRNRRHQIEAALLCRAAKYLWRIFSLNIFAYYALGDIVARIINT